MRKIVAVMAALCVYGARAAERTVSTAVDLVAALEELNALKAPSKPNVIYLSPGSYDVSTYHMESWDKNGKTSNSQKHLALSRVTVSGTTDNPRDTVIYGDGTDGIVHCYYASLKHLTVSNGCDTADRGGGVYSGTHSNVIVTCCSSSQLGGGIGTGTWYDCTIISNRSTTHGGGVYGGTLYNCNIISNYSPKSGGGCYYGTTLHDCVVEGNTAAYGGGVRGSMTSSGELHLCHIYGGLITGNTSTDATEGGGGAYGCNFYGGTVVSNNVAAGNGGGVWAYGVSVATNTTVCFNTAKNGGGTYGGKWVGCKIFGNECSADGGGCYLGSFTNSTIAGNVAKSEGGGGYRGFATNCVFAANTAAYGGGVCSNECVACEIANNISTKYGGGCHYGMQLDCTITNNLAETSGGGGRYGTYSNCLVACNMVTSSVDKVYGGGLSYATATGCVISNNVIEALGTATDGCAFGAGVYNSQVYDSTVTFNMNYGGKRDVYGGGAYLCSVSNSLITGNACYSKVTSGKYIQGGGGFRTAFTNCVIRNNYTRSIHGPGINGGEAYGCLISNNVGSSSAAYVVRQVDGLWNCEVVGVVNVRNGPAVNCRFVNFTNGYFLASNENVVMDPNMRDHIEGPIIRSATTQEDQELIYSGFMATNCLIANNRISGGLFYATTSLDLCLQNCTIANNVCQYTVLNATNGTRACAINSLFVGNKTSAGVANDMNFPSGNESYFALTNCLVGSGRQAVAPGYEANTVTSDVPCFVKGDGPDRYALKHSSPARGKGLVQDWMTDALDIRQDGAFPRLRDGSVDIGCYQCWLDPIGFWIRID